MSTLGRRQFLAVSAAGGGFLIGVRFPQAAQVAAVDGIVPVTASELTAWIRIAPDDTITLAIPHGEIGQGIATAQAMLIADELDADWARIETRYAEADKRYGPQGAGGSQSIIQSYKPLRQAGATARAMLVAAAAAKWKVKPADCTTEPGFVVHAASKRRLSYGALAADAAKQKVPQTAPLKAKADWRYIGKPMPKREAPLVVQGKQTYGLDVQLPDMLIASIEHPPTVGAVPHYDPADAMKVKGVLKVIALQPNAEAQIHGGVAVLARNTWAAFKGRDALAIRWEEKNTAESQATLTAQLQDALGKQGDEFHKAGDFAPLSKNPDLVAVRAEYESPFLAHMMMEPGNCTVQVKDGVARGWGGTQSATSCQAAIAKALGPAVSHVVFQPVQAGGGFGRRSAGDVAAEAAMIAAQADGRPVKLVWKREDDTRLDQFRPLSRSKVEIYATKGGDIMGWGHHLASTLGRPDTRGFGTSLLYDVPNLSHRHTALKIQTSTGAWRGVDYVYNIFAVESAVDELAAALGEDPLALRRRLLTKNPAYERIVPQPFGREPVEINHARMVNVMDSCAKAIGWNYKPGAGRGMGIAIYTYAAAHCSVAAEVAIGSDGALKVTHLAAAIDVGQVVNPLGFRAQIEGGLTMGLSAALREQITIKAGRPQQSTYTDYRLARMRDIPKIDVVIIDSDRPPVGAGEMAVPGVGAAVANAIFAATGERIRAIPFYHAKPSLDPGAIA